MPPLSNLSDSPERLLKEIPMPPFTPQCFSMLGSDLYRIASSAARTSAPRANLPVLAHTLFTVTSGNIMAVATDLEVYSESSAPCDSISSFAFLINAKAIASSSRDWRKETVTLTVTQDDEGVSSVSIGHAMGTWTSCADVSVTDFPKLAMGTLPHTIRMSEAYLRRALSQVSHAISTEETRYYLNGIYLHNETRMGETMLQMVATDGHRLALTELAHLIHSVV